MDDCQLAEKIKQRKIELKTLFDKVLSVEEQYKQLGSNDQEIEEKIQDAFV